MTQTGKDLDAGRIVLIASGKGGVGKSTLAVNCGAALAARGRKVLLIDSDAGLRSLDLMLAVSDRVIYDIGDVLSGRCEPARAIIVTDCHNLHLMSAPQTELAEMTDISAMRTLYKGLSRYYDYVIVDSPAGIGLGVTVPAQAADSAVIVTTNDHVCIRDAGRMAQALRSRGILKISLVINRVDLKLIRKKIMPDLDEVIDGAAVQLLGVIPEDKRVIMAASAGKPVVVLRRGAAAAFSNIAARLDGEDIPLMKF
jgi:septum site-determining protein MinD